MHLHRLVMQRMAHAPRVRITASSSLCDFSPQNDGISQRELAETLHLSPPRVSSILQALWRGRAP